MSRKSTRLLGKRRQDPEEYVIDVNKNKKRMKLQQEKNVKQSPIKIWNDFEEPSCSIKQEDDDVIIQGVEVVVKTEPGPLFSFPLHMSNMVNIESRANPLPELEWGDTNEVWQQLINQENSPCYKKDSNFFLRHKGLQDRMRAILFDWLIEVTEVYKMHRETFYLAVGWNYPVDFFDRYMSLTNDIHKNQLQLIGITALFIAAKAEEIYPPRLTEFSYVTDGACSIQEIVAQEVVMLKVLKWNVSPITPVFWIAIYLQTLKSGHTMHNNEAFLRPQFSPTDFINTVRLLDLCTLDTGCLQFSNSLLASAALFHTTSERTALAISGYKWSELAPCAKWMAPFANALLDEDELDLRVFKSAIASDDAHNIQTHVVNLQLYDRAQTKKLMQASTPDAGDICPILSREFIVISPIEGHSDSDSD